MLLIYYLVTQIVPHLFTIVATMPLPSFHELSQVYPGYRHYGGAYGDELIQFIVGDANYPNPNLADTSALRLSVAFNKLGGEHSMGTKPIEISKGKSADSISGFDNLQYIFRTTAFGPYLAQKYKSPELYFTNKFSLKEILEKLHRKRGIIRILTFRSHGNRVDARIALWDCDKPFKSRYFFNLHHKISIEFWELSGSPCTS
ncbi:hypothetical protein EB796_019845 [Bugula neritina]|uniref:Uncharacterized protein n=1 Tax=Bugula neritina TaxID=10212 RepID=A0A7J7J8Z8_BUGNE|nr:hypothetical protein EB796_019845 [Bugula neritina]